MLRVPNISVLDLNFFTRNFNKRRGGGGESFHSDHQNLISNLLHSFIFPAAFALRRIYNSLQNICISIKFMSRKSCPIGICPNERGWTWETEGNLSKGLLMKSNQAAIQTCLQGLNQSEGQKHVRGNSVGSYRHR